MPSIGLETSGLQEQIASMPLEWNEDWSPDLFGKQWDVFNNDVRITLVNGNRLAAKTIGCQHRIMRHLWEVPNAHFAMIAKSIKVAKDGGTWQVLTTDILNEWLEGDLVTADGEDFCCTTVDKEGNPIVKTDGNTRTQWFGIRNKWGGESVCKLYSVHEDGEIFNICKNKFFTGVFFVEFSAFQDQNIMATTLLALRPTPTQAKAVWKSKVRFEWLADTNPCEKKGADHWIFREFYTYRNNPRLAAEAQAERIGKVATPKDVQKKIDYYSNMRVIEMRNDENPHVTEEQRIELENSTAHDPLLYDSHFLGEWTDRGSKMGRLFSDLFAEEVHVIGSQEEPRIAVQETSYNLITGWDLGQTNHAAVVVEKWHRLNRKTNQEESCFSVLDELVYIDQEVTLTDFTLEFLEIISNIEHSEGKHFELQNWADSSALDMWRPNTGTYDYMEVLAASDQRLNLEGVEKPANSVQTRIRFVRRLLKEGRIFISWKCENTINMLKNIKRGKTKKEPIVRYKGYIHVFDALSYILLKELSGDFLLADTKYRPRGMQEDPIPMLSL